MFATMCVSDKNGEIKADFCLEVSLEYFFSLIVMTSEYGSTPEVSDKEFHGN